MKKLRLVLVVVISFGITACTNDRDFETYVSDLMYMYDDIESGLEDFSELQSMDNKELIDDVLLEDILIMYSDLSVKFGVAKEELDLIGKYGSDKFLYNAAYKYIDSVQSLYQNDLHKFVMLYAKYKQNPGDNSVIKHDLEVLLNNIVEESDKYELSFEKDLGKFIAKYDKID